jgi:hypothetical protein
MTADGSVRQQQTAGHAAGGLPGEHLAFSVDQLADWELRDWRTEIERKLEWLLPDSPRAQVLRATLDEITAIQQSRGPGRLTPPPAEEAP